MSQGIYKITNLINGKCYVGQSIHIEKRWRDHISTAKNKNRGVEYTYPMYNSFRKHGTENFKFEILELVPNRKDLTKKEQFYYDLYKPEYSTRQPKENISNVTSKAVHKIDMETLEIIETYYSAKEAGRKHNINGSNIAKTCRSLQVTAGGFYWCYQKDYHKDWKPKERDINTIQRKVSKFDLQNNFIKSYDNIKQAAKENNVSPSNVTLVCRGVYKQAKGFIWRYTNSD